MPECDSLQHPKYDEEWVKDVLPGSISESSQNFVPEFCSKFIFKNDSLANATCTSEWFEHEEERCDRWVFDESERTIVNDVRSKLLSSNFNFK